jgi:hypothetical protein
MIPYSDLVAALRHWRARNGMPVVGDDVGPPPSAIVSAPPGPSSAIPLTRPKPPAAPFPPARPDDEDEIEAEVLSEEMYENEGDDFAMSFSGGAPPPAAASVPAPPRENTQVGVPPVGSSVPSSFGYGEPSQTQPEPTRTESSRTDPAPFGGADDDFAAEIAASIDARHTADSVDETLVADDPAVAAEPKPKKPRGKKR